MEPHVLHYFLPAVMTHLSEKTYIKQGNNMNVCLALSLLLLVAKLCLINKFVLRSMGVIVASKSYSYFLCSSQTVPIALSRARTDEGLVDAVSFPLGFWGERHRILFVGWMACRFLAQ